MKTRKGYVNEGKVLLALSICSKGRVRDCSRCPYDGGCCGTRLTRDALRYINELNRKVTQYEEEDKS